MKEINWDFFATKYFKFENDIDYLIHFSNPRTEERVFDGKKVILLVLDVLSYQRDNRGTLPDDTRVCNPPMEFSTRNQSFITKIRPYVDRCIKNNEDGFMVIVRRTNDKEYNIAGGAFLVQVKKNYGVQE